jgi:hypothetical protein
METTYKTINSCMIKKSEVKNINNMGLYLFKFHCDVYQRIISEITDQQSQIEKYSSMEDVCIFLTMNDYTFINLVPFMISLHRESKELQSDRLKKFIPSFYSEFYVSFIKKIMNSFSDVKQINDKNIYEIFLNLRNNKDKFITMDYIKSLEFVE